jgi:hypothetical protein
MAQDEPQATNLSEYTDDSREVRPPNVTKRKAILLPETKRQVGSLVWDAEREWNAYLSSRTEEQNYFRIHNAYPISVSLLGRLQHYEVERVLIAVRDDEDYGHGTVYEFDLSAYLPENSPTYVWERDEDAQDDEQACPDKDDDSAYIWPTLGSDLFK